MVRVLLLLICGPFIVAALLTPTVYSLLIGLYPALPWPFSRVYSRVATVVAAVLVYVLRKDLNLALLKDYFAPKGISRLSNGKALVIGVLLSMISAVLFFPFILQYGKVLWSAQPADLLLYKFLRTLPAALLIGVIEESFFRVILFELFQKKFSVKSAAVIVSIIYAVIHFVAPVKNFQYASFSFLAGFSYLSQIFERMIMLEVLPPMFGLFLVGLTLAYTIYTTRSIYLTVGLHAGWVLAVKLSSFVTVVAPGVEFSAGVGRRYYLVSTTLGWASILLVWGAIYTIFIWRPKSS